MAMQEPLEELLAHLRAAIDEAEDGSGDRERAGPAGRPRSTGASTRTTSEGVVDDLRDEVTKFEASHPTLADAIGRAADALSALGL